MLRPRYIPAVAIVLLLLCACNGAAAAHTQDIVDRIAARVENDVILSSEVHDLGAYQQLVNGRKEDDAVRLDRLIDQWIVRTEAEASRFPQPSAADADHSLESLRNSQGSAEVFAGRLRDAGLSEAELRRIVAGQIYLTNYLDSRFRPAIQIEQSAIDEFYEKTILPLAKAKGEAPPSPESARDSIREILVQRGINEQADRWLKESRARLHVVKVSA